MKWIKFLFLFLKTIVLFIMIIYVCQVVEFSIDISTIELINKLDGNEIANFRVRWELEDRGKSVVKSLILANKYKNERIREKIPLILAHINGRESFPFLIEALKDKNDRVAANAKSAITYLARTDFNFLETLLSSNDRCLEEAAIKFPVEEVHGFLEHQAEEKNLKKEEIIERFTGHMIRLLNNNHGTQTRIQAMRLLVEMDYPNSASYIIPLLEDKELFIRINAIRALVELESVQAVPFLIRHLKDSQFQIRMECAAALGFLEAKNAVLPLIELFQDKDWRVIFRAIISLGLIKDERFIAPSIQLFKTTKNEFIKRIILYSLKKIVSEKHAYLIPFLYQR